MLEIMWFLCIAYLICFPFALIFYACKSDEPEVYRCRYCAELLCLVLKRRHSEVHRVYHCNEPACPEYLKEQKRIFAYYE